MGRAARAVRMTCRRGDGAHERGGAISARVLNLPLVVMPALKPVGLWRAAPHDPTEPHRRYAAPGAYTPITLLFGLSLGRRRGRLALAPARAQPAQPSDALIMLDAERFTGGLAAHTADVGVELWATALAHRLAALGTDPGEELRAVLLTDCHPAAPRVLRAGTRAAAALLWLRGLLHRDGLLRASPLPCRHNNPLSHLALPAARAHATPRGSTPREPGRPITLTC